MDTQQAADTAQSLEAKIARVCHEANRAYCAEIGDTVQLGWGESPLEMRASAISGVRFRLQNPDLSPREQHAEWVRFKQEQGWTFGRVNSPEQKTHPNLVPWDELPVAQVAKDRLFLAIVGALAT